MLASITRFFQESSNYQSSLEKNEAKQSGGEGVTSLFSKHGSVEIDETFARRKAIPENFLSNYIFRVGCLFSKDFIATVSPHWRSFMPLFASSLAVGTLACYFYPSRMAGLAREAELSEKFPGMTLEDLEKSSRKEHIVGSSNLYEIYNKTLDYYDNFLTGCIYAEGILLAILVAKASKIYQKVIIDQLFKIPDSKLEEKINFCAKHSLEISDEYIHFLGRKALENDDLKLAEKAAKIINTREIQSSLFSEIVKTAKSKA